MGEVFALVTVRDFGEGDSEPEVRVFSDPESARAESREAWGENDYVALHAVELEPSEGDR